MIDVFIIHRARCEVVDIEVNFLFRKSSERDFWGIFQKFFKIFFRRKVTLITLRKSCEQPILMKPLRRLGLRRFDDVRSVKNPLSTRGFEK
jgi:hypothetical protein